MTHREIYSKLQGSIDATLPPVKPQEPITDRIEYGTDGNAYRLTISNGNEFKQEPKTGHWIDIMVGDMPAQACDRCNTFYPLAYTGGGHKYCPNCGCRMVEPQESEDKE